MPGKSLRVGLLLVALLAWVTTALMLSFTGTWMKPAAAPGDAAGFMQWARATLEERSRGTHALTLIEDGRIVATAYGGPQPVDENTVFPTASFSKWIAALTVMSLVEDGTIDLDAPVSNYLTRWQLPASAFDHDGVTPRRLLSHTAGLTDGLGFGDYLPGETVPTVWASLDAPRASQGQPVIAVGLTPGSEFKYSGGGYLILEALLEELTGLPYPELATRRVLAPLGMQRSTFADLAKLDNASRLYDSEGGTAPHYRYASAAATGFASSSADLTRLAVALLSPAEDHPWRADTLAAMQRPEAYLYGAGIWGLGTMRYAETVFGHDGANEPGINTAVRLAPSQGSAIIALVSGTPGLATELAAEWVLWQTGAPDYFSIERALASAGLPAVMGSLLIVLVYLVLARRRR